MNPVSEGLLEDTAWLLSGFSPASQCLGPGRVPSLLLNNHWAFLHALALVKNTLLFSDAQEVHITALLRCCGLYFHWIFGWRMLCCYSFISKSLLMHVKLTKDANESIHSSKPSRPCWLKGLQKMEVKKREEECHLVCLKCGAAEGGHCVGSVTTLDGNISGLPPVSLLWYRPGLAHLYSRCKKSRRVLCWLFLQDLLSLTHSRPQTSGSPHLVSRHFSCSVTLVSLGLQWLQLARHCPEPSTHFPTKVKEMNCDMKRIMLWGRELQEKIPLMYFHMAGSLREEILIQSMGHVAQFSLSQNLK